MKKVLAPTVVLGMVAGAVTALIARFVIPFRPRVNHQVFMLPRNHADLSGLRLAYVSDTHVGPTFTVRNLQTIVRALRREKPDILLLGGDYVSQSPYFIDEIAPSIAEMTATARFGSWAVIGNHDVSNVRSRVERMLHEAGAEVLVNRAVEVETDRGPLWLAGIDDLLLGRPDPAAAFAEVPADAACICLWHEPDAAEEAAAYAPFLMLSGHTHGGQVRLPGIGPLALPKAGKRFASGRFTIGDMTLFVSNGVGLYRPPVRLGCPPELVMIHLVA
ncbi:MAG: metallophosphoesterase [Thermomicrobiales bacterium]